MGLPETRRSRLTAINKGITTPTASRPAIPNPSGFQQDLSVLRRVLNPYRPGFDKPRGGDGAGFLVTQLALSKLRRDGVTSVGGNPILPKTNTDFILNMIQQAGSLAGFEGIQEETINKNQRDRVSNLVTSSAGS